MGNLSKKKGDVYQKKKIPKKVKEEVWVTNFGRRYESKCYITWCSNKINVFNFHVGHDKPESKGGTDDINNLKPICDRCNLSMSNNSTIQEWNKKYKKYKKNSNLCNCIYLIVIIIKCIIFYCYYHYVIMLK